MQVRLTCDMYMYFLQYTYCPIPRFILFTAHPHAATGGHFFILQCLSKPQSLTSPCNPSNAYSFARSLLLNRSLQQRSLEVVGSLCHGPTDRYTAQAADSAISVRLMQAPAVIRTLISVRVASCRTPRSNACVFWSELSVRAGCGEVSCGEDCENTHPKRSA